MTVIKEGRMKAYLFIEGETRQAKKGEWYITSRGEIYYVEGSTTCGERNILTRREIEVPEGTYECHGHFHNHQGRTDSFCIPIYHPKKKVKKTVYLYVQNFGGKTVYSVFDNDYENKGYPVEIEVSK
jgi:hypothetical protein